MAGGHFLFQKHPSKVLMKSKNVQHQKFYIVRGQFGHFWLYFGRKLSFSYHFWFWRWWLEKKYCEKEGSWQWPHKNCSHFGYIASFFKILFLWASYWIYLETGIQIVFQTFHPNVIVASEKWQFLTSKFTKMAGAM